MNVNGWTNKGVYRLIEGFIHGVAFPSNLRIALVTATTAPTSDTNTLGQLEEIAAGNGYTSGGVTVNRDTTDWPSADFTEDDANDRVIARLKDILWTASGDFPISGAGARYAVLTDNNGTIGSREVYFWWDLGSPQTRTSGQTLLLQDLEIRGWTKEAA